jgi:murein DD-endopeptidase MepM/ murein hydrolase activator NlpD
MEHRRVDGLAVVGIAFMVFMLFNVLRDTGSILISPAVKSVSAASDLAQPLQGSSATALATPSGNLWETTADSSSLDPDAIAAPYDHYELTQGPHGFDYGQMAIDIAAGKGAEIKSPINGVISALYVDDLGNTVLLIENLHYIVTMFHGIYTVKIGDAVQIGQPVGYESNQGNTVDALGRSCRGRDCGYHTHLNIFDKQLNSNVNPLTLISP